ncbi:MAG TPA: type IV pilus twitching motility protein PilT [Myxococcaceae bacterium]|nr:type IV pilus twitching motility protein PilT [Myxococcaceae bacterium]
MAKIDSIIERLFRESATEMIFESGAGVRISGAQGVVEVVKQPLSTSQIIAAFAEIAPEDLRPLFPAEGATEFPYAATRGMVNVRFEKTNGAVRAVVSCERTSASDQPSTRGTLPPPPPMRLPRSPSGGSSRGRPAAPSAGATARMKQLLDIMLKRGASDLHLSSEQKPMLRLDGDMAEIDGFAKLEPDQLKEMVWSICPSKNRDQWEEHKDTDFAHETTTARFRVNVFEDRRGICAVLRQIPNEIRTVETMGLSQYILDLAFLPKGLVLVTGPTGSGKSTTLAALIDYINRHREDHIITIEDPIEFVHPNKKCLVNQREVGVNTKSFKQALRAALREDPDIVLVGELRDLETMAIAIETAETGHLVFGTLHTNTAPSTVDRIIDQFPPDRQGQIRMMLSESLKAVISQTLCKKIGGGRIPAQEVLICTSSVANLIREAKTFQIPSVMQTGRGQGMVTLNDALFELVKKQLVAPREAYQKAVVKVELRAMLERAGFKLGDAVGSAA